MKQRTPSLECRTANGEPSMPNREIGDGGSPDAHQARSSRRRAWPFLRLVSPALVLLCAGPAQALTPVRLRCEGRDNPLGVDVANPRLSWILEADRRGERQTAYQIVVEDSWDSGKVESDETVAVPYEGEPLAPATPYAWRVRVWDKDGRASTWSTPASFCTGKLGPDDWRGTWIRPNVARGYVPDGVLGFAVEAEAADAVHWVQVDLGQPTPIDAVVLHPMNHDDPAAGGRIPGYGFPLRFRLETAQSEDGREATVVVDQTATDAPNPGWVPVTFAADGHPARYVRLTVTRLWQRGQNLPFVYTLGEMQVLSHGTNVALGRPVTASASVEGYGWGAGQLTDGLALSPEPPTRAAGSAPQRLNPHGALYLRREIETTKPVTRALAFFCGLGFSELAVDGRKVGSDVIGPGLTTYDKRVQYLALDVTDRFTTPGRRVLDVTLADGWYALERDPWVHTFEQRPYVDQPKLLLDLHLRHPDGSETVVVSDLNWRWSEGEIVRSWIAQEDIDARASDRDWRPVAVASAPTGRRVSQREPPNRIVEEVRPVSMTYDVAKGTCTWDLGREMNGWVRLRAAGPAGTVLAITTIPSEPRPRTSRFTLAGTGEKEVYEPRFFHAGMRRVEVTGLSAEPAPGDLVACLVSSMYAPAGQFRCADEEQNWLNDAVRRTVVSYTTFLPNDPVREWKAWTQDIESMFRSAAYLFDSQTLYERWQHDLLDGQRADGNCPNIAPGPFFDSYNSPWWGGCVVWLPWYWYLYYGDASLLRESYPAMKRYVDYLGTVASNGLQDWGLADWLPVEETPRPIINTPAYVLYARIVSLVAAQLDLPEEARQYGDLAEATCAVFNERFLDPATGIYGIPGWKPQFGNWNPPVALEQLHTAWWSGDRPCTQAGQALPLALGMVPPACRDAVEAALLREIAAHHNRVSTGFVSTPYLLEVLADLAPEVGWAMTSARDFPSWHSMTRGSGNDLMKETWAGGQALMPSLGGNLAAWQMEALGGIRPDPVGPGFGSIIIAPHPVGDLEWVESHYDSVRGRVVSNWRREGNQLRLDVGLPANTSATVTVPAKDGSDAYESGIPLAQAEGVAILRREPHRLVLAVGSGSYRFQSTLPEGAEPPGVPPAGRER